MSTLKRSTINAADFRLEPMGITDELQKLDELRRNGSLTAEEFAKAKARLLSESTVEKNAVANSFLDTQIADVRYLNELARIDREWEMERVQYEVVGRFGRRYIPTVGTALARIIAGGIFGLIWTAVTLVFTQIFALAFFGQTTLHPAALIFPGLGVLCMLMALVSGFNEIIRAQNYKSGYRKYQARRQQLIDEHERQQKTAMTAPVP